MNALLNFMKYLKIKRFYLEKLYRETLEKGLEEPLNKGPKTNILRKKVDKLNKNKTKCFFFKNGP